MSYPTLSIDTIREKMPHPSLTRIIGEPDYQALDKLYKQLKANAYAIHSTLGGGNHGHLGMILTPANYTRHSQTPWVTPNHPGPFTFPDNATRAQIHALKEIHNENMHHFITADSVQTILNSQIKNAIDEDYIAAEIDSATGTINNNIPTTMTNLFQEYGQVTTSLIDTKLQEIKNKTYDPAIPLASTFKRIEELVDLADAGQLPFTNKQQISIALDIIKTTGKFSSAIKTWLNKPEAEQEIWNNFKQHFNEARNLMKKTGELDKLDNPFQANALREIVVEGLTEALTSGQIPNPFCGYTSYSPDNLTTPPSLSTSLPTIPNPPSITSSNDNTTLTNTSAPAYSATEDRFEKMQTQMMEMMKLMTTTMNNNNNNNNNTNSNNQNRNSRRQTNAVGHSLYCWSHGLCNHRSNQCRNKKEGHQDKATFGNRMDGSENGIN